MTLHNPLLEAVPDTGTPSTSTVREKIANALALVVTDAAAIPSEDFTETPYNALIFGGEIFPYDASDTTTAHDGVSAIVDLSGRRYKKDLSAAITKSVIDKDLVAQPSSPTVGDAYLLTAAPTGTDWASKAKHYAVYTARGWLFVAPATGMILYVADEDVHYVYDGTSWGVSGLGSIAEASLTPNLLFKSLGIAVEDERSTPPGSPTAGLYYIVGTVPTGQWLTDAAAQKIAFYEDSTWKYITPYDGAEVYDKDAALTRRYDSGTWSSATATAALIDAQRIEVPRTNSPQNPLARGPAYAIFEIPYQGLAGDVLEVEIDSTTNIRSTSGAVVTNGLITASLRIDDSASNLAESSLSSVTISDTGHDLDVNYSDWLPITDALEHKLKFLWFFSTTGTGGSSAGEADFQLIATIRHYRTSIQTDGVL